MEYFIWLKEKVHSFIAFFNKNVFLFCLLTLTQLTDGRVKFRINPARAVIGAFA